MHLVDALASIRSYGAVMVVGAGLSIDRFPLTADLPALLWHAIDSHPDAVATLREKLGASGGAKQLLGNEPGRLRAAWDVVRATPAVRASFQSAFAALDADKDPTSAHFDLARLIESRHVEVVISFNWDTCLERAHEQLFGVPIRPGVLYKPHGDAAQPDGLWILPDEDGQVPGPVNDRISTLRDRPRTLVTLGYSGSDATVVEQLLQPLQNKWPVVRISPSATGEGALAMTATEALSALATQLTSAVPASGWRHVVYTRRRSMLAALQGMRLGPADVDSCPELPAVARIAERLATSRIATVSGASGVGKSLAAFQAARRLNQKGWTVLELSQPGIASLDQVTAFRQHHGPVVAVIDDAQAIPAEVRAEFAASIDDDHAVLLVSTERLELRDDESLSAAQAVRTLHKHCRANLATVAPMLIELDDRVRWSAFFKTPDERLDAAFRSATEPWLYMFIASGGERRITNNIDKAVDHVHAALVLAAICIAQLASQDAGVTIDQLIEDLEQLSPGRFAEH